MMTGRLHYRSGKAPQGSSCIALPGATHGTSCGSCEILIEYEPSKPVQREVWTSGDWLSAYGMKRSTFKERWESAISLADVYP
jgi:hypothetical protein